MGSLNFVSWLLLTACSANGFKSFRGFQAFNPSSLLRADSDSDFSPLEENTMTDLGLKLVKYKTHISQKECLKTCEKREGCLRAVHCKDKPRCAPGTFCSLQETSRCYIAANTGEILQPAGICTFSKEVHPIESGVHASDSSSLIPQEPAKSETLSMGTDEESENKKAKKRINKEGLNLVAQNHESGFHIQKKIILENQETPNLMKMQESLSSDVMQHKLDTLGTEGDSDNEIKADLLALVGALGGISSNQPKTINNDLSSISENTLQNQSIDLNVDVKSISKSTIHDKTNILKKEKKDTYGTKRPKESRIPKGCKEEPTYLNQGAVRKRKLSRPGYPVVIEYECDQNTEEKYKYFSGPREALCDDKGTWTLPAMYCIPTSCYSKFADSSGSATVLYSGDTHRDIEGRECQAWKEDSPHSHSFSNKVVGACTACRSVEDIGNKCRDTDDEGKPWCYTMDPEVRWEFCDIKECKEEQRCGRPPLLRGAPALRTELIGQKVHVTYGCHADLKYISGRNVSICDMQTGVWEWPNLLCAEDGATTSGTTEGIVLSEHSCPIWAAEKCFYYDHDEWMKAVYQGNISTTKTGRSCQRWDSQTPHEHTMTVDMFFGVSSLTEMGNVCRDPDEEGAPWCYTTDPDSRWEYCPVPECTL